MTKIYEIADDYVERYAALDPVTATGEGIAGHDHELTDYSPAGGAARVALARETLAALDAATEAGDRDRIAAEMMRERLELASRRTNRARSCAICACSAARCNRSASASTS